MSQRIEQLQDREPKTATEGKSVRRESNKRERDISDLWKVNFELLVEHDCMVPTRNI